MEKKILTLLIALSIIIIYIFSPLVAATTTVAVAENKITVEEPVIEVKEEIEIIEDALIIEKEEEDVVIEELTTKYEVPKVKYDFKSYTDYLKLNRASNQWKKVQSIATSDDQGLRWVDGYVCVAMASYYTTTVGDLFRITTDAGNTFEVIITDFKSDKHTDSKHQYTKRNQCIVEFYVDMKTFNTKAKRRGSISMIPGYEGTVISIEKIGNYFEK